jgi:hypothetical protein
MSRPGRPEAISGSPRQAKGAEHHLTVPRHSSLRVGTLSAILADVAGYVGLERHEVVEKLFAR